MGSETRTITDRVTKQIVTIFGKTCNNIKKQLHSHQVQHTCIWDLWLHYPTVAFNGYDPVAF